jgi:hypothetical protein
VIGLRREFVKETKELEAHVRSVGNWLDSTTYWNKQDELV